MEHEEWKLPSKTFVHQNPLSLPNMDILKIKLAGMRTSTIKEVVFFGRLETRKGVPLFCDAIERLLPQRNFKVCHYPHSYPSFPFPFSLLTNSAQVTFLGRKDKIMDEDAVAWLKTRSEGILDSRNFFIYYFLIDVPDWNVVPKIIEDATREEALFYLAQNESLIKKKRKGL